MRISLLRKELEDNKIDLALIFSFGEHPNTNMVYFANYSGIGILAVMKKVSFLLTPEMEYEKAVLAAKNTKVKVYKAEKKKRLLETLSSLLSKEITSIKRVGIDEDACNVFLYKRLKKIIRGRYIDIYGLCSKLRMKKSETEIFNIRKACAVCDRIFKKIYTNFKYKSEHELRSFIEEEIKNSDCELSFPPIVASSKSSSQPHYAGSRNIKKGFLLLDFGAKYKDYCSDMTRMLYIGKPTEEEISDYNLVLRVVNECEKSVLNEKTYSGVYKLSLKILGVKSPYFTHGLGHGLGLDIHELPSLTEEDKNKIEEMVPFTIEPGIYFMNKYGIRIEDTLVIKNRKVRLLTKAKKELIIIKT